MAEKRKPRFRIFRKIRTLNESETPIREKNDQTNPPMNSQRNKNETLNRWKELALFCSRNLGGWWIGGGISMTSGSMVLPEGSILWLFVPQQERRKKKIKRVNVHAGVIWLCRTWERKRERKCVKVKLKIEERETLVLLSGGAASLIDWLLKRKFKGLEHFYCRTSVEMFG